jgi:hypothetical protein
MRSVWFVALVVTGCRGLLGIEEARVVDPATDAPAQCATWSPDGIDPCALGAPSPAFQLGPGTYTYDTTDGGGMLTASTGAVVFRSAITVTQPDQSVVAVMSVEAFTLDTGATLRVVGRKPLVIVAWSTIAIDGELDASSQLGVVDDRAHVAQTVRYGAGANEGCTGTAGSPGKSDATVGGSGGGGGGGQQGLGGAGAHGAATLALGGAGGSATSATSLRGGCPGGASGAAGDRASPPASKSSQAQGGAGGGGLRLIAYDAIRVAGSIAANGAGGAGAPTGSGCGGGGGGSGGQLELDARTITVSGVVVANGGGGGGGGDLALSGRDGADGRRDDTAAPGGAVQGCGAPGGSGAAATQLSGVEGILSTCGGGGGGGGAAGLIIVASPAYTALPAAKVSPSARLR